MTERRVDIRLNVEDDQARRDLLVDKALLDDIGKRRTINLKLDSNLDLAKLNAQMDKLDRKTAKPAVEVKGLTEALFQVMALHHELEGISGKTYRANIKIDGNSVNQAVDNVARDAARTATGGARGGGGGGGFLKLIGGFAGRFGNFWQGLSGLQKTGLIAGGGPITGALGLSALGTLSGLIEAAVGTAIGGGVGALGLMGVDTLDHKAFKGVSNNLSNAFLGALTQQPGVLLGVPRQQGIFGKTAQTGTGGPSFLTSTLGILKQISQFIKIIGPSLGEMFRASVPFVKMFASVLEQAAKLIIPSFTQAMKNMTPALPIMTQGFVTLVKALTGFINALGPQGMKAGAQIFLDVTKVIEGIMIGLGHTIDFLARLTVEMWHAWRLAWDFITHIFDTAVLYIRPKLYAFLDLAKKQFEQLGKDIANIWNSMWNNVVVRFVHGEQDLFRLGNELNHEIANIFDGMRHEVAHLWDMLWSVDLVGIIDHGVSFLLGKVRGLVTSTVNFFKALPGDLLKIGKAALDDLWNGMKSVAPSIMSWLKGFAVGPLGILGQIKSLFGINSPSREFFKIGAGLMQGLSMGLHSKVGHLKAQVGNIGGNVMSWIKAAMAGAHAPSSWLPALERLVSLESGGNPRAVNSQAVDGQHATGLWQMLPSTYAAYAWGLPAGDLFNPVVEGIAALRYIMSNYGSPYSIPGLMSGNYHGYAKGGWISEPVLGIGMNTGATYGIGENGPEYVSPHGGGVTVIINAHPSNNPDEIYNEVWKGLRHLKQHRGNQPLGLG